MIYTYTVKHNGVVYPAGTDVPVGKQPEVEKKAVEETPKQEPKKTSRKKK